MFAKTYRLRLFHTFFLVLLAAVAGGCHKRAALPTEIAKIRGVPPNIKTVEMTISRQTYRDTLKQPDKLTRMRVIPLVARAEEASAVPEYRLFSIYEGSPAELLGLQNADVLVAANGFIIYEPAKFKAYLALLQNESQATIEVRRSGQPLLLKYTFE
ncbi:MAG: hypothetical protein J5J00_05120 [Deltaproteobacteria bacterium]|nr:hypothetical protein [Deltaproteobacteria bacterium]